MASVWGGSSDKQSSFQVILISRIDLSPFPGGGSLGEGEGGGVNLGRALRGYWSGREMMVAWTRDFGVETERGNLRGILVVES